MEGRKGFYEQVILHISGNHVARLFYENIGYADVEESFRGASFSELVNCVALSKAIGLGMLHFHLTKLLDEKKFTFKN